MLKPAQVMTLADFVAVLQQDYDVMLIRVRTDMGIGANGGLPGALLTRYVEGEEEPRMAIVPLELDKLADGDKVPTPPKYRILRQLNIRPSDFGHFP